MRKNTTPDYPPHHDRNAELINFLRKLWRYGSEEARCYTIMAIDSSDSKKKLYQHFCLDRYDSFDELIDDVAMYVETYRQRWAEWGMHAYFQVLPLAREPERGRGTAQDVRVGKVLFADFDFKTPLSEKPSEEKCEEKEDHELDCVYNERGTWFHVKRPSLTEFLKHVRKVAEPSVVVDSGGGYHVYYLLSREVEARELKKLLDKLVDKLQADPQAKDLARILRLPTTINPRLGRECRVIYESNNVYSYDELEKKLAGPQGAPPERGPEEPSEPVELLIGKRTWTRELEELDDEKIRRIVELLRPAYVPGHRQSLSLYISGMAAKGGKSPISVAKIIKALHAITNDEDPLAKRLEALVYTYAKAGVDLSKYADDIERITGVSIKTIDPRKAEVKGKTGLQEILEATLKDSDEALTVLSELSRLLGTSSVHPRDAVIVALDEIHGKYAVADYMSRRMGITTLDEKSKKLRLSPVVAYAVPVKITIYINPIDGTESFEVILDGPALEGRKPHKVGPVRGEQLLSRVKAVRGVIVKKDKFDDVFDAIMYALLRDGRIEIKMEIPQPGFYVITEPTDLKRTEPAQKAESTASKRLVIVGREVKEIDKEKLREALNLLDRLAGMYTVEKFATVIKWGAAAPLGFVRKQLGSWSRGLYLHGDSDTGKTTLGRLVLAMWDLRTSIGIGRSPQIYERGGASADTPARLGQILSSSTFPVLINEPEGIFSNPELVSMLKNAMDSTIARSTAETGLRDYYALATVIITSNKPLFSHVDVSEVEPLAKRFIVVSFDSSEKIPAERQAIFNKEIIPQLPKLAEIGNCITKLVQELGVSFFERNISEIDLGKELITKCYEAAELPAPRWLEMEYTKSESSMQELDIVDVFRTRTLARILDIYAKHYREDAELEAKVVKVIVNRLVPGIEYIPASKEGDDKERRTLEGDQKKDRVAIKRSFLDEIKLEVHLSSLAKTLGWKYKSVRIPMPDGESKVVMAMSTDLDDFVLFLTTPVRIEEENENKETENTADSQS